MKLKKVVEDSHEEGGMARGQLERAIDYATMLRDRIDSEDDFDAFRWHQWVEKIDLNDKNLTPYDGKLGFAFIGFCCDKGVGKNRGRVGAANGPKSIRKEMANLPCSFSKEVKLFDAGNIFFHLWV